MPTTSTRSAVKRALLAVLQARPGLSDVSVTYSAPGDTAAREMVFLGDVNGTSEWGPMKGGRKLRDETLTVDVHIVVTVPNDNVPESTREASDERVEELGAEVENALADDPSIGNAVQWAFIASSELTGGVTQDGHGSTLQLGVECRARLT